MSNRKIDPAEIHFDENTAVEVADLENEEYYVEGERLTEESAQRLAAEMLERVRAKNLRPGGKSLSGGNKHSPVVQVRVSELTRDKLQAIADARGMSVSKLSRKVLDEDPGVIAWPPGRNQPCWCGSGRKYKKCCAATSVVDTEPHR